MPSDKPSILITGANGFVGSHLCRTFLDKGYEVIAGVRKTSDLKLLKELNVSYRYGDVCQPETLAEMVAGVDYIIHNAGIVKARTKGRFYEVNEQGTKDLCDAIVKHNPSVKRVILISSAAASGPSNGTTPRTEDEQPEPITVYGASKLAGEKVALSYADRFHIVSLRPSGVYGPADTEIFGFFQTVNSRIRPCLGNMNRRLQVVHVADVCHAARLAITGNSKTGTAYFIAEDRSYSMKELVGLLVEACGRKTIPLIIPGPLFRAIAYISETVLKVFGITPMLTREKANELLADWEVSTAKAREHFGYESKVPFEQGARETFEWYRKEGWL